jgi:hypothetical protein
MTGPTEPPAPTEPTDGTDVTDVTDVTNATEPPPADAAPRPPHLPIRDSAVAAVTAALPVMLRPSYIWLPTLLTLVISIPTFLLLPRQFFTGPAMGQAMTPAEARALVDQMLASLPLVVGSALLLGILFAPFVTSVNYSLAADYVEGRPPDPIPANIVSLAGRMLGASLILFGVGLVFALAGALIFGLLAASGAGLFILLLLPILVVFGVIVFLRLLPVPVLVVQGRGVMDAVQTGWAMTEGHVQRIFRWGFVLWLVGLAVGIAVQLIVQLGSTFLDPRLAALASTIIQAPFALVIAIVITMLTRLLQHGPTAPEPARVVGPDWGAPPR